MGSKLLTIKGKNAEMTAMPVTKQIFYDKTENNQGSSGE